MTTAVEKYIEEFGPMTRAEAHRVLVCNFDAAGLSPAQISVRIGITPDRVEQILDQLDGVPHDIDPAPEPAERPAVTGSGLAFVGSGRGCVVRCTPAERPAARRPRRAAATHGTYGGYVKHAASKGRPDDWPKKPCDPCGEARRQYQRDLTKRHAREALAAIEQERPAKPAPDAITPGPQRLASASPRVISRREYGLKRTTGVVAVDADAARAARNAGATVYRRTVTEWEIVP